LGVAGDARGRGASVAAAQPWDLPSSANRPGAGAAGATGGARDAARRPGGWRGVLGRCSWLAGPVAICAGLGVILASGMRWATVKAYGLVEFDVHGTDPDQHGRLTVVLGILAVAAGLLLAAGRLAWGRMLAIMTGLMVPLTATVDLVHLYREGPFADNSLTTDVIVGPGLWLAAACGFLVFLAGLAAGFTHRSPGPRS
ncbi:hypothetical protein, partial [Frankia canadensis]|uniref:hypothetical protein n=1 Tax=Frankia canadensis TaxID=1836972 RepID=UPI001A9C5DEF